MLPAFLRWSLLPIALILTAAPAAAGDRSDGFHAGRIMPNVWSPCLRPEGYFFMDDKVARSGQYSAGMALFATPDLPPAIEPATDSHPRSGCLDPMPMMEFNPGHDQRAEL